MQKNNPFDNNFTPVGEHTTVSGSIIAQLNPIDEEEMVRIESDTILVLPLYDIVAFPDFPQPVKLEGELAIATANDVSSKDLPVWVGTVITGNKNPSQKDFYPTGVIAKIAKIIKLPDQSNVAFLTSFRKATLNRILKKKPFIKASVSLNPEMQLGNLPEFELKLILENLTKVHEKIMSFFPDEEREPLSISLEDSLQLNVRKLYSMAQNSPLTMTERLEILDSPTLSELVEKMLKCFDMALQRLSLQASIHMRTHESITSQQKEMFLKQQLKTIQEELGENSYSSEIDELKQKANKKKWSKKARNHFEKELSKLEKLNIQSPDYSIQYSYLENLLDLPWDNYSSDDFTLSKVEKILDRDHYGLEKVKERILEQMAVIKLRKDLKAPILCLYGPPGVGKTSLGKSIAEALGREYARISLGGVHDEAEIRGHRRTYVGAMPGRIISALAKCGSGNPVFVLDEIDKIRKDFKGDPSTALLEVLDPEQNSAFHDNYVDFDYDLSKILFIATANDLAEISAPLLDRMEVIEINGYIPEEKIEIAIRHLVPKVLEENGFDKNEIHFEKNALSYIISHYTRESGVRRLEKNLAKILRKIARLKAEDKNFPSVITQKKTKELLGVEQVNPDKYEGNEFAGVVTGLAWTQAGGEILFIETSLSPGKGDKLTLTGNLGDVMKESAVIALEYIKAHSKSLGISPEVFDRYNVHIHVPEGAIPKDGPSAGITMATSLISAFTGRKVRNNVAMTGEITLRGKVLPVGGIKEKILAAKRAGIIDIILSAENKKNVDEINQKYLKALSFHFVNTIADVIDFALLEDLADNRFDL